MQVLDEVRGYWRWTAGYSNPNQSRSRSSLSNEPKHNYKPKAIRIPSLLSLFLLFVIALTALEVILDKTVKPSEYFESHHLRQPTKRQVQPQQCPSPQENSRILFSLRSKQSDLCTTYTTTFKPSTTDLSPPMQTSFDIWLAIYSSMEAELERAENCDASQSMLSALSSLLNPTILPSTASAVSFDATSSQIVSPAASAITSQASNTQATSQQPTSQSSQLSNTAPQATVLAVSSTSSTLAPSSAMSSTSNSPSNSASSADSTSSSQSVISPSSSSTVSPSSIATSSSSSSSSIISVSTFPSSESPTAPVSLDATPTSTAFSSSTTASNSLTSPPFLNSTTIVSSSSSSTSAEPTCTELNSPCFECGAAYCTCQSQITKRQGGLYCAVDFCHCTTEDGGETFDCSDEDLCTSLSSSVSILLTSSTTTTSSSTSAKPECTEVNSPCSSCGAEYCNCQSILSKRQGGLYCAVDLCHCSTEDRGDNFSCSTEDLCATSTSIFIDTSTSSVPTPSASSQPECTEADAQCSQCDQDYCTCQYVLSKRQENGLYCGPDPCHCTYVGDTVSCDAEDLCSSTSSSTTSEATTITSDILSSSPTALQCSEGSSLCAVNLDVTPTLSDVVTTTSLQPVCTDTSGPCFECGFDYCTCDAEGGCVVDQCHCTPSESEGYVCSETDTCTATCVNSGDTCQDCNAGLCICQYNEATEVIGCEVDMCHCRYDEDDGSYHCNESVERCSDTCQGETQADVPCGHCDFDHCVCDLNAGQCAPDPCYCSNILGSWTCGDINTCESSSTTTSPTTTITAPPTCGTPGLPCLGCGAGQCLCNAQPIGNALCEVNTCKCSLQNSSWQCNTVNTCTSTSNAPSSTSPTQEPPLPGATCNPSIHQCYNCVADKCACGADGMCYVDSCYCDYISPGQYSCGTTNKCNPGSCDESHLQCFGCSSDDLNAACYCSTAGECVDAPCPDCEFLESGTVMNCPDSCGSTNKRSLSTDTGFLGTNLSYVQGTKEIYLNRRGAGVLLKRTDQRVRTAWGIMDKRQGFEVVNGPTPIRDAWNYLLWTKPLTVRRTSSSIVTTTTAATFTLDIFEGGSTSWPPELIPTPPLAFRPTVPACIPATLIAPAAAVTTIVKRDQNLKSVKPYVTRESTTVVVRIRDNYLEMTSNMPTITRTVPLSNGILGAALQLSTQTMTVESIGADGLRTTQSVVVVQPGAPVSGNPAAVTGSGSGNGGDGNGRGSGDGDDNNTGLSSLSDSSRIVNLPFTPISYVAALYFPAIMAVAIKILFETMVASIKMMEPFERLHRSEGATASESLYSQYLSSSCSLDTIRSIFGGGGRSIPLWSLIIYVLVTIAAPLSSASMTVQPLDTCSRDGFTHGCYPAWVLDLNLVRLLEALLVLCMVLTIVLAWDSWKYHAGVPTNPTSIASMAVLLNYEPLRNELQTIDPDATEDDMNKALSTYHFWLLPHSPARNQLRYGIIHSPNNGVEPYDDNVRWVRFLNRMEHVKHVLSFESRGVRGKLRLVDGFHMLTTVGLFAILITYRADLRNDAFNEFFASRKFLPKFLIMCLAAVLDMQWKNLEREVRITEPYRRLYAGNARAESTILCTMNGTCWSNLPRCISGLWRFSGMWFEALIGVTAIFSDINIIAVSGVLMTYSTTKVAYEWSSITALATTSIMSAVLLLTVIWWRRTEAVQLLPRTPETVAAVLSYLCISRMAIDLAAMGMESLSKEERDEIIISKNRRYRFGLMMGEDGKMRYCVDYDDEVGDDGSSERDSWLQEKIARPRPIRLSL